MRGSAAGAVRTMPDWRAAWQCSPTGFATVSPLSGRRALLAVGSLTVPAGPGRAAAFDAEGSRNELRSVLADRAMVDGHDPPGLFHRVNATLSASGLGRIESLALLSRAGDGTPPAIAGVGRPLPLVVTPDGLSTPVDGTVALGPGWAVVVGGDSEQNPPLGGLLTVSDVSTALSLFSRPSAPGAPFPARTLLAVVIDG